MWTCPYCHQTEPLAFQMGHINNCLYWQGVEPEMVEPPFQPSLKQLELAAREFVWDPRDEPTWDL